MAKIPEILRLAEFLRYLAIILCKIQNFKYKSTVVGSLLQNKTKLVPLVLLPSFLKIDANWAASMIMDLYRC
jgi:hypothetical protein